MRLIGDVHGMYFKYYDIASKSEKSLQLGDFGFKREHDLLLKSDLDLNNHKVLFGNHDYYPYLNHPHSLGDFSFWEGIFCIRGANSIDKHWRREGLDWFREEEITSYPKIYEILGAYEKIKPEIVVTHDCTEDLQVLILGGESPYPSATTKFLTELFSIHQPDRWFFGHYHKDFTYQHGKTTFRCLNELSYVDL